MSDEITKLYSLAGVDFGYNNFGVPNIHPPFTAEKQIELILFYINRGVKLEFEKNGNKNLSKEVLTNTIAGLACRLWQDLTEAERNEIKNILKG